MAADKQRDNLVEFDSCLAAAVDALQQAGQWKGTLESGGSSNEVLAQPEPSLRQVNPCNPSFLPRLSFASDGNVKGAGMASCDWHPTAVTMELTKPWPVKAWESKSMSTVHHLAGRRCGFRRLKWERSVQGRHSQQHRRGACPGLSSELGTAVKRRPSHSSLRARA